MTFSNELGGAMLLLVVALGLLGWRCFRKKKLPDWNEVMGLVMVILGVLGGADQFMWAIENEKLLTTQRSINLMLFGAVIVIGAIIEGIRLLNRVSPTPSATPSSRHELDR